MMKNLQNHIECEKKYRNKNINDIKDANTTYLCLTCSCKIKAGDTNNVNSSKQRGKGQDDSFTLAQNNKQTLKQKFEICKDQRIPIFNKKN